MSRTRTGLLAAPAAAAVLVLLTACSGDSADAGTTSTEAGAAEAQSPADQAGEMPGGGTSGEIAAVSDALMQVQGDDGQTAVAWDGTTTITQRVTAALSDVTVGSCVVAFTSGDDGAAATSVAITAATDDGCTGGLGGGGFGGGGMPSDGEMPSGMPTDVPEGAEMPDGAPTDMPSGAPDGASGGGFGGATAGLVTAVDGSTITVESTGTPGAGEASDDASTSTATITVDDATTFTSTVAADATAIAVGRCVTAQGEADSSGQVTATSLTLSDATADGCSTGFGGRGGMGGPGGSGSTGSEGDDA